MGDSLQKRLEEMERANPSVPRTDNTPSVKPTWHDKWHFWKRKKIGKIEQMPQKTSTFPRYENYKLTDYYLQHHPRESEIERGAYTREKRAGEESSFNALRKRIRDFLVNPLTFLRAEAEEDKKKNGPHANPLAGWDRITHDMKQYRTEAEQRGLLGAHTQNRFDARLAQSSEASLAYIREGIERSLIEKGGRLGHDVFNSFNRRVTQAVEGGALSWKRGEKLIEEGERAIFDTYKHKAPKVSIEEARQKYAGEVIHGLPFVPETRGKEQAIRWHRERLALNNPGHYRTGRFHEFSAHETYEQIKKNNPPLSASLLVKESDHGKAYSPHGIILKKGVIHDAGPSGDMVTTPYNGIRISKFSYGQTEGVHKGLESAVQAAKRPSQNWESNELSVTDYEIGGFYMAEDPTGERTNQTLSYQQKQALARLAKEEGLPLYEFKQGTGFTEVNPDTYLIQRKSELIPPLPTPKKKTTRRVRTAALTAGVTGIGIWLLIGSGITGNVIASEQAQTIISLLPLLGLIGLLVIGVLVYAKRGKKEPHVLKAV